MSSTATYNRKRRDEFVQAALIGLCSTPLATIAAEDPAGPSKIAMLAMMIGDATINTLDKVAPPKPVEPPKLVTQ